MKGAAPNGSVVLERHRLDRLVRQIARIYRKAHVTDEEWKYVNKRLRRVLGLRGRPVRAKRLPEILAPEELRQILEHA